MNTYWAGNLIQVPFTITDETQTPPALGDPTTITVGVQPPGGAVTHHTWPGGDGVIVHDATGKFHLNIDTTGSAAGNWTVVVETTGIQTTGVQQFTINQLPFT